MNGSYNFRLPTALRAIEQETRALGFGMASDALTGALLRTLAASKPSGVFLELGTGTGPQPTWPEGHAAKVPALVAALEQRKDLVLTKLDWSTGLIVATKKAPSDAA